MISKAKRRVICLAFSLIFAAGMARGGEGAEKTLSPYFLLEGDGTSDERFPLKSTVVEATVNVTISEVVVTQTYANEGNGPIHGRYVFPASTRASVHGMKITIGEQAVVAKIQERKAAKREFEKAKAEGKSASLLEEHRPNVFQMSVANILPGDRVEVELRYTELLVPEEGIYQFVYPTVVGPRYSGRAEGAAEETDPWIKSPYLHEGEDSPEKFDLRVTLSTALAIQDVTSPSHPVNVDWQSEALARVSLADPSRFGGNRDFILNYRLAGREIRSGLLLYQGEKENFFLLMVQPPERVRPADLTPREYIFVLDVSGSMGGFPLDTAKEVIRDLIGHLRETDLFNVVLFSGDSRVMGPISRTADGENVREAIRMIEEERGGGGTELIPALERAVGLPRRENYSRSVVVITDGFVQADREVFRLIGRNLARTNFFCFGIGSSVNRYLLEGIARAGAGEPFVVTDPSEAPRAAARFREYIESPVLTDLHVRYDGFEAYDVEPPALHDLFAKRPVIVFGKWRGRREGEIEVSGRDASGKYTRTFRASETEPLAENGALPYLWARERIARLSDYNFGEEDSDVAGQITSLGLTYSLLTRHTSFIAVVEKVRNPEGGGKDVDHPLPLPQGVSELAAGGGCAAGPEPELWLLVALAGLGTILMALLRRRRGILSGRGAGREGTDLIP